MGLTLDLLWRGPLDSCNYACGYCPFAKRPVRRENLEADRLALSRFTDWVAGRRDDRLGILVTPWGEALVHAHYREALVALSRLPQVRRVAIQSNGSRTMDWAAEADASRLALWLTYHPTQVTLDAFLARCTTLLALGVRFSVGAVACEEHADAISALRRSLPGNVHLWLNARQPGPPPDEAHLRLFTAIDPRYPLTLRPQPSRGRACSTGERAISVDGAGDIRRCWFVDRVIGNIYRTGWERSLGPSPCPRLACGCHIGWVRLQPLGLERVYGDGILERIPEAVGGRGC